jgi:hypothetical protein
MCGGKVAAADERLATRRRRNCGRVAPSRQVCALCCVAAGQADGRRPKCAQAGMPPQDARQGGAQRRRTQKSPRAQSGVAISGRTAIRATAGLQREGRLTLSATPRAAKRGDLLASAGGARAQSRGCCCGARGLWGEQRAETSGARQQAASGVVWAAGNACAGRGRSGGRRPRPNTSFGCCCRASIRKRAVGASRLHTLWAR